MCLNLNFAFENQVVLLVNLDLLLLQGNRGLGFYGEKGEQVKKN